MLDDKIAATDWEATQEELIQQVARESYLQWLCESKDNKTVSYSMNKKKKKILIDDYLFFCRCHLQVHHQHLQQHLNVLQIVIMVINQKFY